MKTCFHCTPENEPLNSSVVDLLDETFEASFRNYADHDEWAVRWTPRLTRHQGDAADAFLRLACDAWLRVPQLLCVYAIGSETDVYNRFRLYSTAILRNSRSTLVSLFTIVDIVYHLYSLLAAVTLFNYLYAAILYLC